MGVALGLLFAAVPLVAWALLARTRVVGSAVGGVLLAGAGWLVAVQQGWIPAHRADAHAGYAVGAALLVALGGRVERRVSKDGPGRPGRGRGWALGLLCTQLVVTFWGSVLYVLVTTEASVPPARAVPALPPGLTVVTQQSGCGSGNCYRLLEIGSTTGLSHDEIVRALDRPHETCRPNGWLLDRRELCVGVDDSDGRVRLYVSLSNLLD
ncbi:MFS transporter [Allostreptomyces psammosilenae]|uniref:Uncharacterized protein n=1 Tax=Allostreptomyces psammosilenae TaxID=1892865 RepID=A0A853A2I8_9ACTN|nr:MFS transporter [Allostreptomyces psammosilenae]NYI04668.1 hypothetical protein [Allostreptomyces psammosilenae]